MRKEEYISLKNLLWRLIFAWREVLVLGILFALMLPILKYGDDKTKYEEKKLILESSEELTEEEYDAIELYERNGKKLAAAKEYQKYSFYTNSNPYNVYTVKLEFVVTNIVEGIEENTLYYVDYFNSGKFVEEKLLQIEMDENKRRDYEIFLKDIMVASCGVTDEKIEKMWIDISFEKGETIDGIELAYSDIVQIAKDYVLEDEGVIFTGETTTKVSPTEIRTVKDEISAYVYNLESESETINGQLSERQKTYINNNLSESDVQEDINPVEIPKFSIKVALLGFIIGIVIAIAIVFVKVLFANKLQELDEIVDMYGLKVLGCLCINNKSKNVIDNWLLEKKNKAIEEQVQTIEMITTNIKIACESMKEKKVYLTGSVDMNLIREMEKYHEIKKCLLNEGIELIEGDNILLNAQSYMKMCETSAVIFVEGVDCSLYKDMDGEFIKAHDADVKILGCMIVA